MTGSVSAGHRSSSIVDAALLTSARRAPGTTLWTRDKRLKSVADALGLGTALDHP
jgi:predicted nucleic acid-binding protein